MGALVVAPARFARAASAAQDDTVPASSARFGAAVRLDSSRFTVVAYPGDLRLARSLLADAVRRDTFPGLPRPREHVLIAVAPDRATFRAWVGPGAPEWGSAIAAPDLQRIVMQGSNAGSDAGDPLDVLRHELAHLALHEALGELPPRWFDEGYASFSARELERDEVLATNVALALRGMPALDALDSGLVRGPGEAQASYALAYRAVADLAALDPQRGLSLFFRYWKESKSFDVAVREAYGITAAGFEKRWQQQTRRSYGALALLADFTLGMLLLLGLITPLVLARRRRDRRRMAALVAADEAEAERRQRESVIEELLRSLPPSSSPPTTEEPR
ncbi:MAG TPA: hypothetical protein VNS52_04720 [Gemmatimonadaceae bacterium]|nr:hypothetical protein [Gemmatimonadaceae bacterium]